MRSSALPLLIMVLFVAYGRCEPENDVDFTPDEFMQTSAQTKDWGTGYCDRAPGVFNPYWVKQPLKNIVNSPWNVPESDRHTVNNATKVQTFKVYDWDKPMGPHSHTKPRCEWSGMNRYSDGASMLSVDFNIPYNLSSVAVV